jgi:hypothetical protein
MTPNPLAPRRRSLDFRGGGSDTAGFGYGLRAVTDPERTIDEA